MRKILLITFIIGLAAISQVAFAQQGVNKKNPKKQGPNLWEKDFVMALQKGKMEPKDNKGGLAYTPAQGVVLEKAIKKAMEMKAPACEAMKIAVDLKYDPYSTLTHIFGYGSQVNLNQVCGCATESGISKQVIAKAASNATTPLGKPVFPRDEIAQAQCLTGLGYTPYASVIPRVEHEKKDPVSLTSPTDVE